MRPSGQFAWSRFIARRLVQGVPLIIGVIVINFVIIHLAPGDPVTMVIGEAAVSPDYVEKVRHDLGLDQPLPVQLLKYLWGVVRGDLGTSYVYRRPVLPLIVERIPPTLLLMGTSLMLGTIIAVALGVLSAMRMGRMSDQLITVLSLVGFSAPVFWLGLLLILLFSLQLGWLPSGGYLDVRAELSGWSRILSIGRHLILPGATLAILNLALVTRLTRASMLEVMKREFITVARAKGLTNRRVVVMHALPNALLPVLTVVGLNFGLMLSGAVLTETVFAWPGLGRLTFQAVGQRDYPLLLGMFAVTAGLVIIANLLTDIAYAVVDPRIRYA